MTWWCQCSISLLVLSIFSSSLKKKKQLSIFCKMLNYSLKGVYSVETIKHTENQFKEESMLSSINVLKGAIAWLRFANTERWLPNSFADFPSLDVLQYLQGSTASFLCYVKLSCVYDTLTHAQDLLNELVLSRWIWVFTLWCACLIIEQQLKPVLLIKY